MVGSVLRMVCVLAIFALVVAAVTVLLPTANGQQSAFGNSGSFGQNFYGSSGMYQGQTTTNSAGGQNFYGSSGMYQGRSTPNSSGGQNFYGSSGMYQGSSTPNFSGGQNFHSSSGMYQGRTTPNSFGGQTTSGGTYTVPNPFGSTNVFGNGGGLRYSTTPNGR